MHGDVSRLVFPSPLASSCLTLAQICDAERATPEDVHPVYTGVGARSRRAVWSAARQGAREGKQKQGDNARQAAALPARLPCMGAAELTKPRGGSKPHAGAKP